MIFNKTNVPLLSKALDAYNLRHKVVANNIANLNTSGYGAKVVNFEEYLSGSINASSGEMQANSNHFQIGGANGNNFPEPKVVDSDLEVLASGVNNVDIDSEMAELAKNQIRFRFASRMLADIFRNVQKSIRGNV